MSQIPLRSVRLNARPATTLQSFVGTAGEIFYDSTNQTLRVYPGNIAAGKILADRDWVNAAIGDIGSSSLVNGTRTVSLSTAGSLTIPGDIRCEGNINIEINLSDSTLRRWQFGEDGNLTFPDGTNQSTAWTGSTTVSSLVNGANTLSLGSTGTLTLPNGSVIEDSPSYIKLTPAGGANEYQSLLIYPTAGDGNHIHLAAPYGGGTELYLGNDIHYVKLATSGNVEVLANAPGTSGWIFGTDGDLKIPGDIRSEGNINIEINLADSTLRRWQFGEDGILTAPGAIDAPSMFTNLINSADSSAITITPAVIFNSDVTVENDLVAKNIVFSDNSVQTTAWTGSLNNPTFTGTTTLQQITEVMSPKTGATGVVVHDFTTSAIFYHTSPAANFTINITNVPTTVNRVSTVVLVITQGVTGYYPNVLQIDGSAQTINWIGNVTPTPSASRNDIVSFTLIRTAAPSWIVTGAITGY
jgi:energy-converting hydrogenase Eha subunit B